MEHKLLPFEREYKTIDAMLDSQVAPAELGPRAFVANMVGTVADSNQIKKVYSFVDENPLIKKDVAKRMGVSVSELDSILMKGKDAEKGSDDFNAMVKVWNAEAQETYGKGMLKFDLYQDVHGVVQRIRQSGHKIALFSSASVDGLKSAFKASTIHGFINRFFSSEDVGGKYEPGSYQKIAHDLGVSIGDMIYVSEDERESAQQLQVEE